VAKHAYAPPDHLTVRDAFQVLAGILSLVCGLVILARTFPYGVYLPALVSGGAFVAFGAYRLWLAWIGWQLYLAAKGRRRS
jgi:hypothetical protein